MRWVVLSLSITTAWGFIGPNLKNHNYYHHQQQHQQKVAAKSIPSFNIASVTPTTKRSSSFNDGTIILSATNNDNDDTNNKYDDNCDVLVLGSGPAARSLACLLAANGKLDVVVADQNYDRNWVPNYGVWKDEWETIVERYKTFGVELDESNFNRQWQKTDCYFGGSFDIPITNRMRLDRPYCQISRNNLKDNLSKGYRVMKSNHFSEAVGVNIFAPTGSLLHDKSGTTIQLKDKGNKITTMRTKIVVDTTGHETKLTLKDKRGHQLPPGFQIAYGALVELDESNSPNLSMIGPYDKEAMTLFDYRTDHFSDETDKVNASKAPTFMYAMPIKDNLVFFEETSLVARPAVSFQDCKDRCYKRLEYHGIKVTNVLEEEYCYIPMGGALPAKDQRIIAFGGAAAMVHPSTGYHLCRAMMGASNVAQSIQESLDDPSLDLDSVVAKAFNAIWTPENIRQRNFAVFGGDFLMQQDVEGLRGFFDGFFRLPLELWGGFLAGWPGLAYNKSHESWFARMWFGLNFIIKIPLPVALKMALSIGTYSVTETLDLVQSVTPFLGAPEPYDAKKNMDRIGDVAAKNEARMMIQQSTVTEEVPVAFDEGNETEKGPEKAEKELVAWTDDERLQFKT